MRNNYRIVETYGLLVCISSSIKPLVLRHSLKFCAPSYNSYKNYIMNKQRVKNSSKRPGNTPIRNVVLSLVLTFPSIPTTLAWQKIVYWAETSVLLSCHESPSLLTKQ